MSPHKPHGAKTSAKHRSSQFRAAAKKARGSGSGHLGRTTEPCPDKRKPGKKKVAKAHSSRVMGGGYGRPPKKPKSTPRKPCSLVRIDVHCGHHRRERGALLEVVPKGPRGGAGIGLAKTVDAYVNQWRTSHGESMILKAVMYKNCGRHPLWHVREAGGDLVKRGSGERITCELAPPHVSRDEVKVILGAWWLKNIRPRHYSIECEDHVGGKRHATVAVYPSIDSGLSIDLGSPGGDHKWAHRIAHYKKLVKKVTHVLNEFVPNLDDLKVEALEGKVALENTWAEEASTNRAHWEAEVAARLDPLVSIGGTAKIVPSVIPKPVLKLLNKYVADISLYFSVKGEINAGAHFRWRGGGIPKGRGAVGGAVGVTVGAHAKLLGGVAGIDISGGTKLVPECGLKGTSEPQIELEGRLTWKPLKVRVAVELLFGLLEPHKDWDLFGEVTLVHMSYDLL